MRRSDLRLAACFACAITAASGAGSCSLFVDLDGLSGSASDASTVDVADAGSTQNEDSATDAASSSTDAGSDSTCSGKGIRRQSAHLVDDGGTDDSLDVTLPMATLAGDFIVVGINFHSDCSNVSSIADTAGNTYHELVPLDSNVGALDLETWGAENISASATDTVSVKFVDACEPRNVKVVEYTGIVTESAVDGFVSQHGDGGVTPNAQITTTGPTLVFAHTADQAADLGAGDGWNQIFIDDWATLAEDRAFPSPTVVTVTAKPDIDDSWVIQGVALKSCE